MAQHPGELHRQGIREVVTFHDPRGVGIPGEQRREREEELVDDAGRQQRAVERRPALAQQRADAAGAEVGERGRGRRVLEAHDLERGGHLRRLRVAAGVDEHGLPGRREEARVPGQVERAGEQDGDGRRREPVRRAAGDPVRIGDQPPVALGAQRPRPDHHRVGERAQLREQERVDLRAEVVAAALDRGAPVDGRDHVQVDEGPVGLRALARADLREPLVRRALARRVKPREHGSPPGGRRRARRPASPRTRWSGRRSGSRGA